MQHYANEDEIDAIKEWIVGCKIPHVHANKLLHILRRRVLPNLPITCNTLLKNAINFKIKSMEACNNITGEFLYLKIKPNLQSTVDIKLHNNSTTLELIINIDGFPPFTSSSLTIWPILCKVYTKEDSYKPFAAAVYAGSAKPKNPTAYLRKFVGEINYLQSTGIDIRNEHFLC